MILVQILRGMNEIYPIIYFGNTSLIFYFLYAQLYKFLINLFKGNLGNL